MRPSWKEYLVAASAVLAACGPSPDTAPKPLSTPASDECTGMFIPPKGYVGIKLNAADRLNDTPSAVLQTDYLQKNLGTESTFTHYGVLWIPDGNGGWVAHWEGWLDEDQTIPGPGFNLSICLDPESWDLPRMNIREWDEF